MFSIMTGTTLLNVLRYVLQYELQYVCMHPDMYSTMMCVYVRMLLCIPNLSDIVIDLYHIMAHIMICIIS